MPRAKQIHTQDAASVLQNGRWTAAEVAALLDVPVALVERWARSGVVSGAKHGPGGWTLPGRSLFLFLSRRIEPHYSAETVASLLDRPVATVRGWIKAGRLPVVKLGVARQAAALVPESAVIGLLQGQRRAAA